MHHFEMIKLIVLLNGMCSLDICRLDFFIFLCTNHFLSFLLITSLLYINIYRERGRQRKKSERERERRARGRERKESKREREHKRRPRKKNARDFPSCIDFVKRIFVITIYIKLHKKKNMTGIARLFFLYFTINSIRTVSLVSIRKILALCFRNKWELVLTATNNTHEIIFV